MNRKINITLKDLLIIVLIGVIFVFLFKNYTQGFFSKPQEKTDTIFKIQTIPERQGQFQGKPQIIYVQSPAQSSNDDYLISLISELKQLKTESQRNTRLLQELRLRTYQKQYSDSNVTITVTDSIHGKLQHQVVKWKIKPQKIRTYNIVTKLKPKFTFSAGIGINSRLDSLANPQLQAILQFKNKKGTSLQFGITTDKRFSVSFVKDIFNKY